MGWHDAKIHALAPFSGVEIQDIHREDPQKPKHADYVGRDTEWRWVIEAQEGEISLRMRVAILTLVVLSQVCSRCFGAPEESRKLLEMGAADCESEMLFLDVLARNLSERPDLQAYVLIYGGRKDTKRDEVQIRGARMQRYLVETRAIDTTRVEVVNGGYRERFTVELWLVPKGAKSPVASPTVKSQHVRFRKGRMEHFREPGCFPGKYVVTKARHV